jgi:natural product biosynthesis luciferase-like monooxygenase protein
MFEEADSNSVPAEMHTPFATLVELLRFRSLDQAQRSAYVYLADGETEEASLTYSELDRQASAIGALLQEMKLRGERVLLVYPPGLKFIAGFFGCLYAGAVAVPVYPPRSNSNLRRLQSIIADARATVALTTKQTLSRVNLLSDEMSHLKALRWVTTDDLDDAMADEWRMPDISGNSLALLQYTSGSTSAPKGVMVSHANFMFNASQLQHTFKYHPSSRCVSWLPVYHDMGLIGTVLQPLHGGFLSISMSPVSFLQRPFVWLQAITRYKATISGGPDFAYALCARKISPEQKAQLDLSNWSVAFNGSEPVRAETIEEFARAFEPCGFRRKVFLPCYGLAEATLLVSGGQPPSIRRVAAKSLGGLRAVEVDDAQASQSIVGCGAVAPGNNVAIVDPERLSELPEGAVGEIWVSGPGVAQGYWNRPEQTKETFRAYLPESGKGPFMRTGDLGFLLGGELFVAGRIKDLIIIRGVNHYPQDIEATVARCHKAARPGSSVAFSTEAHGQEVLVVIQEVSHLQDTEKAIARIREAISEEHELQAFAIVLVKPGNIPKTSSGKIQRFACREAFADGTLKAIARWQANEMAQTTDSVLPPPPPVRQKDSLEEWLVRLLAARLGTRPDLIDSNLPMTQLGIDSLAATELAHHIEAGLGTKISIASLLQGQSAAQLAAILATCEQSAEQPARIAYAADGQGAGGYPLSPGQQALWFLHELAPQSAVYNIATALSILSDLDVPALKTAFVKLVNRHECLRTAFDLHDGKTVQHVRPEADIWFEEKDATAWGEDAFKRALDEEADRPFNLRQSPLMRVTLFKRSPQEQVLLLVLHHIIADFWSLAVLTRELGVLYGAEKRNLPVSLAPLPVRYLDYALYQWQMMESAAGEALLKFWQEQLAGSAQGLNLFADRPRPPVQSYKGASHQFQLNRKITRQLRNLAQSNNATLYMVLLAAFNTLLYRYTAQEDISVGSLTSGRDSANLAGMVGYFVNPIVLRSDLSGAPTFEELLARTRQTALSAFANQDYPFASLVERLQPVRDPSLTPLFQVMFSFQKTPLSGESSLALLALDKAGVRFQLGELTVESMALERFVAPFDLTLIMAEEGDAIAASLQYSTDIFDAETISRLARNLEVLLKAVARDPRQTLSQLPVMADSERDFLLRQCNQTRRDYLADSTLHQLFEQQVERAQHATALVFEDRFLTYQELNRRANKLARYLRKLGAGPEVIVAISVERSFEMIIGLLGVLKAGAAYLPLDPSYPEARLRYMLEDSGARLIVTHKRSLMTLPAEQAQVVCLDSDWEIIDREPEDNLWSGVTGGCLAYVIYTSGSTGKPKGVMIDHSSLINFCSGMDEAIVCDRSDSLLAVTSISFDISVLELFWTLASGARVIILSERAATDVAVASEPTETKPISFSLFYFASNDSGSAKDKYRLLIEGAKFADRNGFEAIWTPERHFHAFGGLFPNPSVTSAALATITERISIRAGSVVMPLHNAIRVAEEWSLVDNLSKGRVAIAFASGWHADDFAFFPERYASRKEAMFEGIELVKRLWRGEPVTVLNGAHKEIQVEVFPKPVQSELPVWITAAGSAETFVRAGELGANVLTHLLGQSVEDVALNIKNYRNSLAASGYDPQSGRVTLMLHTFIGEDKEVVRRKVRTPFINYLRSSIGLIANLVKNLGLSLDLSVMTPQDLDSLLDFAFNRYFETSALFGTVSGCAKMIRDLKAAGVDEIACLVDFGVDADSALTALNRLNELKEVSNTEGEAGSHSIYNVALKQQPSLMQCTPSMMRMIMSNPAMTQTLESLRSLMLGGEALPLSVARQVKEELPARLFNMYGPTETTIWSATHQVKGSERVIPIGRPIANTQIYTLDGQLQPQPIGVAGDLYIAGDGLSRGYLHRPDLTAERMIPNPFSDKPGAQMYKTGDVARFLADRTVEFLGRADYQVKVRGFRIELEEVEAVIGEHEAVQDVVVVAIENNPGDARLVAYVVARQSSALSATELRNFAKAKLPDYMVPSIFLTLDALPLTSNGKVNRKALPDSAGVRPQVETAFVAPRGELEKKIAKVWQQALKLEKMGVNDNFFDLGGHSLLMVQVHNQLREVLGRDLPLIRLLEHPTISSLARHLSNEQGQHTGGRAENERAGKQKEGLLRQKQRMVRARQ